MPSRGLGPYDGPGFGAESCDRRIAERPLSAQSVLGRRSWARPGVFYAIEVTTLPSEATSANTLGTRTNRLMAELNASFAVTYGGSWWVTCSNHFYF